MIMTQVGEPIFLGNYFAICVDANGTEFVRTGDEMLVVPLTAEGEVILTIEPSVAFGEPTLILPGGETEPGRPYSVDNTKQHCWEAELYRLRGELLLMQAAAEADADAEACFRRAIEVARRQEAKSWELRATVSLCHLWQKQGRADQARQMLAEIYDWFTSGMKRSSRPRP